MPDAPWRPGAPASPERQGGYLPLERYAAIGDGRSVALIGLDGQVDWLPVPGLTSEPVIAALLDAEHGGRFALRPVGRFTAARAYLDGTNVLRTRFTTATGVVDVTDALATGVAGRLPWLQLVRRVEGVSGTVPMTWSVTAGDVLGTDRSRRFDTGTVPLLRIGHRNVSLIESDAGRRDPVHPGNGPATDHGPEFHGAFTAAEGSRHVLCLLGTDDEPIHVPTPEIADDSVDRTVEEWRRWSSHFQWRGRWSAAVHRSALALKLLIHSPTGAIAAAGTTSLPERMSPGKNYDYRFAWVRDLAYTVDAMLRLGLTEEPHAAVSWLLSALKGSGDEMHVFFTLDGRPGSGERRVDAPGWRGVGPVVSGNGAADQLQLGCYADLLGILVSITAKGNLLDGTSSDLLVQFADEVCERWRQRDSGMWELPELRHYTSSKMACWQALDSACRLHDMGYVLISSAKRRRWERTRDRIRRWVGRHCWSERRGAYVMAKGSDDLDASVLLHTVSGFDRGERMSRTIDALRDELGAGPLFFRYSGMQREEGSFVACAFWLAAALACVGRTGEAVTLMDDLVTRVNDVGLLTEMIDPATGAFLGNVPQALSHLALIQAASTIEELSGRDD